MDTRRREQDANPYRLQPIPTESMDFATQIRGSDYNNNQGPNFTTTQTTPYIYIYFQMLDDACNEEKNKINKLNQIRLNFFII
jgi:hypothetical protein